MRNDFNDNPLYIEEDLPTQSNIVNIYIYIYILATADISPAPTTNGIILSHREKDQEIEKQKTEIQRLNKEKEELKELINELREKIGEIENCLQEEKHNFDKTFEIISKLLMKKVPKNENNNTKDIMEVLAPTTLYSNTHEFEVSNKIVCYFKQINPPQNKIAIKMFQCNEEKERALAMTEFSNMLRCCRSPYVITPYQLAYNQEKLGIAMEYGGISLNNYWENWSLSIDSIITIFHELAKGLKTIHDNNIYHGDIKPQNILVDGGDRLRYTDFGAASKFESTKEFYMTKKTMNHIREFTLPYVAPEVAYPMTTGHRFSQNTKFELLDIYSLSLTMFSLINKALLSEPDVLKNKNVDSSNKLTYAKFIKYVEEKLLIALKEEEETKSEIISSLIIQGISLDPNKRKKLNEILKVFEDI